jgi:hypothetical protein
MGHYNGLKIEVKLRNDLDKEVVDILNHVTFNVDGQHIWSENIPLPSHAFFKASRWHVVLCGQSAYISEYEEAQPKQGERFYQLPDGRWQLKAAASIKEWDSEISLFLYWLEQYVDDEDLGKIVGEFKYEHSKPTTFMFDPETKKLVTFEPTYTEEEREDWY